MESETQSGWSHFLEHLVFKGAGDMGAREIVERIEATGGSINASTGYERTSFDVRGVEGSLGLSMQVLSDLVFRPTLDRYRFVTSAGGAPHPEGATVTSPRVVCTVTVCGAPSCVGTLTWRSPWAVWASTS